MIRNKEDFLNKKHVSNVNNDMTKALKYNFLRLETLMKGSKPQVQDKVKTITDMYKDRNISNVSTAVNMIIKLRNIYDNKTKNRVFKQFDKLVTKYADSEPLNVRMQKAKQARLQRVAEEKKSGAVSKIQQAFRRKLRSRKTYLVNVLLFTDRKGTPSQKPYKGLYFLCERQYEVKAPSPFPEELVKVLVRNTDRLWKKGYSILRTDRDFLELMQHQPGYVCGFKIISHDVLADAGKEHHPLDEKLQDAMNVSCNFRYIQTNIDLNSKTFMESIENKRYTKNECWINSIIFLW